MGRNEYTYKPGYNGTLQERMDSKTNKPSLDTCWEWTGSLDTAGYATIRVNGRLRRASHIAYELEFGSLIPNDMIIMHKCDNPKCVNPQHLQIGTKYLNNLDKLMKNRANMPKGEQHPQSKLTKQQVDEIRGRYSSQKISFSALGRDYGVNRTTIRRIIDHEIWD